MAGLHALALLLALLGLAGAQGRTVEVSTAGPLWEALADPTVTEVVLQQGGSFNFTPANRPPQTIELRGRRLVMRGSGAPPAYIDGGGQTGIVRSLEGGCLVQQHLFVHDCILGQMPLFCFGQHGPRGHTEMHDSMLTDAHCADTAKSAGIQFALGVMRTAPWRHLPPVQLDARRVWIEDSGMLDSIERGATWRFKNVTLMCTGSPTAPERRELWLATALALLATALSCVVAAAWWCSRPSLTGVALRLDRLPEVAAARERGVLIEERIGRGTFGEVYRGHLLRTGETVAVKVLQFPASEQKHAQRVIRECRHAASTSHPNCVTTRSHFTISVRRRLAHSPGAVDGPWKEQGGYYFEPDFRDAPDKFEWELRARSLSPGSNGCGRSMGSCGGAALEPAPLLLTCIVMEYCSGGTMAQAIERGAFYHDTERRELDEASRGDGACILRTARDVARGLDHLHSALALVHRDLSTNNVLMCPDSADPRGFKAKLSDFGLSIMQHHPRTASTADAKGTLAFMPPESFGEGPEKLTPKLDVYSMGICVYCMCSGGQSPYPGLTSFQILARKLREVQQLEDGGVEDQLGAPPGTPPRLQAFIRRCCCDARHRWSAHEAAAFADAGLLELSGR